MIRVVEAKRGRFLVFDNDRYVGKSLIELGEFAEEQAQLFDLILKPGAVVVEVGANIGAHTVSLAKRASKVFAFEPQRRVFNLLCGNLALNGIDNVEPYRAAGGEVMEEIPIARMDFDVADNNFGSFSLKTEMQDHDRIKVIPIKIPCHFLKVDVEGYEAKVLRGAADMIRDHGPVLYVENDRQENSEELIKLVEDLGYKAYWHITPLFRTDNHNKAPNPFGGNYTSYDMLCLQNDIAYQGMPQAIAGEYPDVRIAA